MYHQYFAVRPAPGIDAALQDNEIDIIVGAPTGHLATVAALARYYVGTVALGDGRAYV
jgi:hypothetical protein